MAVAHRVGEPLEFDGYVDDFERNVSAMQFSLDGGATWTTYQTAGAVIDKGVTGISCIVRNGPAAIC